VIFFDAEKRHDVSGGDSELVRTNQSPPDGAEQGRKFYLIAVYAIPMSHPLLSSIKIPFLMHYYNKQYIINMKPCQL
jgi:hypothetical protein